MGRLDDAVIRSKTIARRIPPIIAADYVIECLNVVQIYLPISHRFLANVVKHLRYTNLREIPTGELNKYVRSIPNKHTVYTALALATVVAVLLSTVPVGSTFAGTKSFSNSGNNIKTENSKPHRGSSNLPSPAKSHTSSEHSSHCRHHPSSVLVNIFRHRLQTLQIMLACLTP